MLMVLRCVIFRVGRSPFPLVSRALVHILVGCGGMRGMSSRVKDECFHTVVGLLLFCKHVREELEAYL